MAGIEQIQGLALQQTLSPQMQQSLHILQAPMMELRDLVRAELESNPTLEEETREAVGEPQRQESRTEMIDQWKEYYAQRATSEPWTADAQARRQHFFDSQTKALTLQQHLSDQMSGSELNSRERGIALLVIGNIDEQGYLRSNAAEIASQAGCNEEEAEKMIELVQGFEPAGVGSRDLAECLLIQLRRGGKQYSLESRIVQHYLEELSRRKFPEIARQCHVSLSDVQHAAESIARLEPRPGRPFSAEEEQTVLPDVSVEHDEEGYTVSLNDDGVPPLRIGDGYKDMLSQTAADREVRDYLREKIRGGRFFIRCVQQRQHTLLNIVREIVERQRDFFDRGPAHLKPMTMSNVADAVGVHETTVSRAVSGKYLASPQGLFELKYFFTSGYTTTDGEIVSNESVRQVIAEMVRTENSRHPLSDQEIVEMLLERGLPIARRTVAKYREQLGILPSHLRKSF
ncbi:MAG TPA: RNA polymerase factor sigma-54 [Terrimicrobiaceae bacterium]